MVGLLIVLLCALFITDVVARSRAQSLIEGEVSAVLGAPVQAVIPGRLAGLEVLAGRIDRLDLSARQVPVPDSPAVIDSITARVADVQLTDQRPSGGTGTFEAWLTQEQVRQAVGGDLAPLVSLGSDDVVVDLGFTVLPLRVTVVEGALQFVPAQDLPALVADVVTGLGRIPVGLPEGIVLQDAQVVEGRMRLTGTVDVAVVAGQ